MKKAGGIGHHLAKKLISIGCIVICVDNNKEDLKDLENEIASLNKASKAYFYHEDIGNIENVKKLKILIKRDIGKVDIIINNAGIMNKAKLLLQLTDDEINNIFNVNIMSQIWICREFLPDMILENKGAHLKLVFF